MGFAIVRVPQDIKVLITRAQHQAAMVLIAADRVAQKIVTD